MTQNSGNTRKHDLSPTNLTKCLDLSELKLVKFENLDQCESLHWLKARSNYLQSDEGLENLKQLWCIDLSNNCICYLSALSRYLALGTVILSNNNLNWVDLEKIRHAHFLSISLHGNPQLDSDPYYRIHVIDCLPLIWELDGRLVTVTERLHVKQFFIDTALAPHPVRHKMGRTFKTTAIKNIGILGVVSKQCKYIYSRFPMSEKHTKHTDERRLRYLTHMTQEDILQWASEIDKRDPILTTICGNFLESLLEQRQADKERCNMFLLLLVISLEYQLPTSLLRSTLSFTHLETIGTANLMPYFLLPPIHRTRVVSLLLNAAKVDRDNNMKDNGGLYPQLFMSLYYAVDRLVWISQTSVHNMRKIKRIHYTSDFKALMAGEAVSLMLNIPKFLHLLSSGDTGVANLILHATGSCSIVDDAQDQLIKAEDVFNELPMRMAHKMVKDVIIGGINKRMDTIDIKMSDIPVGDRYLALSDCLPIKPLHSVIWASEFLTKGQTIPKLDPPILNPAREAAKNRPQEPKIGDKVLLGPQVIGEITMLLKGDVALAKIDGVPVANGAIVNKVKDSEAHYSYIDLKALCFAKDLGMWRPVNTEGDKFTLHTVSTPNAVTVYFGSAGGQIRSTRFTQSARFSIDHSSNKTEMLSSKKRPATSSSFHLKANSLAFYSPEKLTSSNKLEEVLKPKSHDIQMNQAEMEMNEIDNLEVYAQSQNFPDDNHTAESEQPKTGNITANNEAEKREVFLTSVENQEEGNKFDKMSSEEKTEMITNSPNIINKKSSIIKKNVKKKNDGCSSKLDSLHPPPQRPTSPEILKESKHFALKLSDANRWLAGGRDVFWEQLRQRPKSGHTPGWKEGLPDNMRKPRPKSAFPMSPMLLYQNRSSNTVFVSSCTNCQQLRSLDSRKSYSDFTPHFPDQNLALVDFLSDVKNADDLDRDQLFVEGYKVPSKDKIKRKMSYENLSVHDISSSKTDASSFHEPHYKVTDTVRNVQSAKERVLTKGKETSTLDNLNNLEKGTLRTNEFISDEKMRSELLKDPIEIAKASVMEAGNEIIQVYIEERKDKSQLD